MRTPSWARQPAPTGTEGWRDRVVCRGVLVQEPKTGGKPSSTSVRPKQGAAPSPSGGEKRPWQSQPAWVCRDAQDPLPAAHARKEQFN